MDCTGENDKKNGRDGYEIFLQTDDVGVYGWRSQESQELFGV